MAKEKPTAKVAQQAPPTINAPIGTEPKMNVNNRDDEPNYILDDDSIQPTNGGGRRSKRILRQQRIDDQRALHRIVNLVSNETADVPDLRVNVNCTLARGLGHANKALQMAEWAYHEHFAGAIIDESTGESMEYRDLIKMKSFNQSGNVHSQTRLAASAAASTTSLAQTPWNSSQRLRSLGTD